jgi:hypothetical protein
MLIEAINRGGQMSVILACVQRAPMDGREGKGKVKRRNSKDRRPRALNPQKSMEIPELQCK